MARSRQRKNGKTEKRNQIQSDALGEEESKSHILDKIMDFHLEQTILTWSKASSLAASSVSSSRLPTFKCQIEKKPKNFTCHIGKNLEANGHKYSPILLWSLVSSKAKAGKNKQINIYLDLKTLTLTQ